MMWSNKELASLFLSGSDVVAKHFMAHLEKEENIDIFKKENFSYLWGMLGIAGIKGIPVNVLDKVWQSLKENNVIEAFDKGVLGDYNFGIIKKYNDNRMHAWRGLDNFSADQKFKKLILMPIVAINRSYAQEVDTQAFNPVRVLGVLDRYPLSDAVKQMLIDMQGHGAACGISGKEVVDNYEKEKVLGRLCNFIAYSKRKLLEYEKDFFYWYIHDAVLDGFDVGLIGLNDNVFANLMADEIDEDLSELELEPLRARNEDIVEFAKCFDETYGFYEKTAAKLIRNHPENITAMMERCLSLMDKTEAKGLVFALELINLKQYKSAVKILIELAKRGKATEMASFLHRLLPNVKGAETMIMSMLKLNLKVLKQREFHETNLVFREYPARLYLIGIKEFIEFGLYKDASVLLSDLVNNGWVQGFDDLEQKSLSLAKELLAKDDSLQELDKIVDLFKSKRDEVEIGRDENRKEVENSAKLKFDFKKLFNKKKDENNDIDDKNVIKEADIDLVFDENKVENEIITNAESNDKKEVVEEIEDIAEEKNETITEIKEDDEVKEIEEIVVKENIAENVIVDDIVNKKDEVLGDNDLNLNEMMFSGEDCENYKEKAKEADKQELENEEFIEKGQNNIELMDVQNSKVGGDVKKEITQWDNNDEEIIKSDTKRKISFDSILKINSSDIDKHFEKIKEVTTLAIKKAEEKALSIKQKVEDRMDDEDIENPSVVKKFKSIANKIKGLKKK
ncbi:MAG: hypothetical protein E7005_01445 [Alphaproteobacteria bacterium]|nr:hypothetical protein [Alphaproteobacteria bacterium]